MYFQKKKNKHNCTTGVEIKIFISCWQEAATPGWVLRQRDGDEEQPGGDGEHPGSDEDQLDGDEEHPDGGLKQPWEEELCILVVGFVRQIRGCIYWTNGIYRLEKYLGIKRQKYCLVGKDIKLQDWALRENMFPLVLMLLVCSGEGAIQSKVI